MPEIRLCSTNDVDPAQPLKVMIDGYEPFAVFGVDGQFYVTADFCTHGRASLSDDGELDGFTITCSWHDGAFDVRTGAVVSRPCTEPLPVFPVRIEDGAIFITT